MSTNNYFSRFPELISEIKSRFQDRALFNEPLAPHLAYKIGGPADLLVFPRDEEELSYLAQLSKNLSIPTTIVGSGTNLLVVDSGIRGITLSLNLAFKEIEKIDGAPEGFQWVRCGGGVLKPTLLEWAIDNSYTGLEFSAGIPGTIGGGMFMNAGTKYGCYGDILKSIRLFDVENGFKNFGHSEVYFGYRESTVQKSLVVSTIFELKIGDKSFSRKEVDRIIIERAEKQPLDFPSCGSTFKNGPDYSSGRLIEKAGLKGLRIGDAEVSLKHANFILNKGKATAKDILTLIDIIKTRVKEQFGVSLECEVIVLGGNDEGEVQKTP